MALALPCREHKPLVASAAHKQARRERTAALAVGPREPTAHVSQIQPSPVPFKQPGSPMVCHVNIVDKRNTNTIHVENKHRLERTYTPNPFSIAQLTRSRLSYFHFPLRHPRNDMTQTFPDRPLSGAVTSNLEGKWSYFNRWPTRGKNGSFDPTESVCRNQLPAPSQWALPQRRPCLGMARRLNLEAEESFDNRHDDDPAIVSAEDRPPAWNAPRERHPEQT
jgi:hypothetical protein